MCSIIVARARGMMVMIALISNFISVIGGSPRIASSPIPSKLTSPIIRAAMYETMIPMRIGTILDIPLPQILNTITVTRAMIATGQLVAQLLIADGARIRPMAMMIGPVTTGGKNLITLFAPKPLIKADRIR